MKRKSYISLSLLLALAAAQTPAAATRADHLNTVASGILRYSASGHDTSDQTSVSAQTDASDHTSAQAQTDAHNHTSAQAQTDAHNHTSAQTQSGASARPASASVSSASDIEKLVNPLAGGLKDSEGYAGPEVPTLSGLSQPKETEAGPEKTGSPLPVKTPPRRMIRLPQKPPQRLKRLPCRFPRTMA